MSFKNRFALRAVLLASAAMVAAPAWGAQPAESQDGEEGDVIVVIGSHLAGVGDSDALPVTVLDREELDTTGGLSTGELLAHVPSVGDIEFTDANTGTNGARGDVTGVNLRGLGSGRTLVLVNRRRIAAHPQSQSVGNVPVTFTNVNSIPSSVIERVEVLRDGASALYGSDAIAGVVNLSLYDTYDANFLSGQYGASTETSYAELSLSGRTGFSFNNDRTHLVIGGSYYHRDPVESSELPEWYGVLDRRDLLPADWQGDTQFDNRSSLPPHARLQAGVLNPDGTFSGTPVSVGSTRITSSSGLFHLQPASYSGTLAVLGSGIGIDDGSVGRDGRFDFWATQRVVPEVDRYNFAANFTHEFDNGSEAFAEAIYYNSTSSTNRAPGPFDASLALIIVPASNYYNPFGVIGSPNRLAGIDAPAGGLDLVIQGYRPVEMGLRYIEVEQDLFRLLGGWRGDWSGWDVETAFGYSEATARDEEFNRVSKTALQNQIALATPDAFNPFGGPNANPESVLQNIRVSSVRYGETSLFTWDGVASRPDILSLPGGDVGLAIGAEFRREEVIEDSDPRLDGTIQFTNGAVPDESDLVGVSATGDFSGDRDVWSAFAELNVPIIGEANRLPLVHSLEMQIAGRFEDASDFGSTFRPKIAGHWFLNEHISVRAAYGEGFRAPNLVQLNQGTITRRNQGDEDPYRAPVTATPNDLGDTYRSSIREGNPDLEPEDSESRIYGVILQPASGPFEGLRLSVDFFEVETTNAITTPGVDRLLQDDFDLRMTGAGFSPNVIRAAPTAADIAAFDAYNLANPGAERAAAGEVLYVVNPYINLDSREVSGIDVAASFDFPPSPFGDFRVGVTGTKIEELTEVRSGVAYDELRRNGNPEWRGSVFMNWRLNNWSSGWQVRYVSDVFDTSARNDTTGEYWAVDSWFSVNGYVDYAFGPEDGAADGLSMRLGVRNLFNELPPYADESSGYLSGLYSGVEGRVVYARVSREF